MARRYPLYLNTIEELLATDENIAIWQRSDLGAKFKDFFFDSFKLVLCNFGSISKTSVHSAKMMDELRKGLGDNLDIFDIYIFPELAEPPEGVLDPEKFAHMHSERTDSKKGGISVYIKTDCLLKTDMEKVVSGYASALDVKIQFQGVPFNISSFYIPPIHSFVLPITQKIIEDSVIVNKARSTIFAGDFNLGPKLDSIVENLLIEHGMPHCKIGECPLSLDVIEEEKDSFFTNMGKFKAIRHDIEIEGTIGHRLITMEMALQGFEIEDLTRTPD